MGGGVRGGGLYIMIASSKHPHHPHHPYLHHPLHPRHRHHHRHRRLHNHPHVINYFLTN